MPEGYITVNQAAALKGVSRSAVYTAVKDGRLPHAVVLGRIGLTEADVTAWQPVAYGARPGTGGRGGRKPGTQVSEETRALLSASASRRWAERKGDSA